MKSADRALQILETVRTVDEALTAGSLGSLLGIPKSSLHAILQTMELRRWLSIDPKTGTIALGTKALLLRDAPIPTRSIEIAAAPILDRLSAETGETVHLGILEDTDVVYIAKRESIHPLRLYSAVGRRLPAYATALGKAMLATLTDAEVSGLLPERLEPLTSRTLQSRDDLLEELARIREADCAVDHEENAAGITCFGRVVSPAVPAAVSISVPTTRLTPDGEEKIRGLLLSADL